MQFARRTAVAVALFPAALLASAPAQAQAYVLDDGTPEFTLVASSASSASSGVLQAFQVPGGGVDAIESISAILAEYRYAETPQPSIDGSPLEIAVWDDPNGDGDPSDAVLLGSFGGHVVRDSTRNHYVTYAFPSPIAVSGAFFIGVALPTLPGGSAVCGLDSSQGFQFDSWRFSNAGGPVNLAQLDSNTFPPSNAFILGRFCLRANDGDYGAPVGTVSCAPTPNSFRPAARLAATGNVDQSTGPWRLALAATDLPPHMMGFLLASQTQTAPVVPPGSMGRLCLGGQILRILPSTAVVELDSTALAWEVDLANVDGFGAGVPGFDAVSVGETWTFQCWFRDMDPGPTSNLSEALSVTFQ